MSIGTFSYPLPVNEPVLSYGPGSAEKKRLKEVLQDLLPDELEEVLSNLQQIREQLKGDFQHKVSELNKITKTLVEKPVPKDAEDYWFL